MNTKTENLRNILARIDSGELEHNQKSYFCDTACCLAGWDVALNSTDQPEDPEDRYNWLAFQMTEAYSDPWGWAANHNNLSASEATLLFDIFSTREVQDATLTLIERGMSLPEGVEVEVWPKNIKFERAGFFSEEERTEALAYAEAFSLEIGKSHKVMVIDAEESVTF